MGEEQGWAGTDPDAPCCVAGGHPDTWRTIPHGGLFADGWPCLDEYGRPRRIGTPPWTDEEGVPSGTQI